MTSNAGRDHLLSFIGSNPAQLVASGMDEDHASAAPPLLSARDALWYVLSAHVVELSRAEVIDEAGFHAAATALVAAREDSGESGSKGARAAASALAGLVETRIPASVSGAVTLGLATEEWLATAARLRWRSMLARVAGAVGDVRTAALTLAETHAVTIMPMFVAGRPAQPTTLAHFLGGVIEPLGTGAGRLASAQERLNRSPLGAGLGVGEVTGADREELATRLGFAGAIPNTLHALADIEDVIDVVDAIQACLRPIARFAREVRTWIRTDPMSFVLDEGWSILPEDAHPTLVMADRLDVLAARIAQLDTTLDALRRQLADLEYGPLGANWDRIAAAPDAIDRDASVVLAEATTLFATGLVVNRAYLGNRAGRGYTTASDLATFLMTEEQVPPAAARRIAGLVLANLKQASLEVSGITQDMIDSAALITIGREIKVEMERLGRFLAPRRYIERRQVSGAPAPDMARSWLADERDRLATWSAEATGVEARARAALASLVALIDDASSESLER